MSVSGTCGTALVTGVTGQYIVVVTAPSGEIFAGADTPQGPRFDFNHIVQAIVTFDMQQEQATCP